MSVVFDTSPENTLICGICLDVAEDPIHLCDDPNAMETNTMVGTCRECFISYMRDKFSNSFPGACPPLTCPCHRHMIMDYAKWTEVVPPDFVTKYTALANSTMMFLCGGCHVSRSIAVEFSSSSCKEASAKLGQLLGDTNKVTELQEEIVSFSAGLLKLNVFFLKCKEILQTYLLRPEAESWQVFVNILLLIANPERRNSLHIRYLLERPKFYTPCCVRVHCFRCKTKDFHEDRSCEDNTSLLDGSLLPCPSCGISLTKADGCNTVTCVCGAQFSWTGELEVNAVALSSELLKLFPLYCWQISRQCANFQADHPQNTTSCCVSVLCHSIRGNIDDARGWQRRHRAQTEAEFVRWWRRKYPVCPSQCATLQFEKACDGERESAALWSASHPKEVARCKEQNAIAVSSLFESLVLPSDRAAVAYKILNSARPDLDFNLFRSIKAWSALHSEELSRSGSEYYARSAMQFLHLYGQRQPVPIESTSVFIPYPSAWNPELSNSNLVFSDDARSVTRPGSVSCYPAAVAALPSPNALFTVALTRASLSSNWITFGIVRAGFPLASSDGVGRGQNSWGFCDDRSQNCVASAAFIGCGSALKTARKLVEGDRLSALCDTTAGWVEISLNDNEASYRFEIPPGNASEFYFASTLANDHTLTVIDEGSKLCGAPCRSNAQHLENYSCFIRYLKRVVSGKENESTVRELAENWISLHGNSDDAFVAYQNVAEIIDKIIRGSDIRAFGPLPKFLTWRSILFAVGWNLLKSEELEQRILIERADNFYVEHGESAPFMAASMLFDYHVQNVTEEDRQRARSFMLIYSDEQHSWYDYNDSLEESMLSQDGKVVVGCRCLPRHFVSCSKRVY